MSRPPGPDDLTTELRVLKRELLWVRLVAWLALAGLGVVVAAPRLARELPPSWLRFSAGPEVSARLNAREIGLFNRKGERVILSDDDKWGYPDLLFFDLKKNCRLALRLEPAGDGAPAVVLYDDNGPRGTWRLDDDGTAALRLFGKEHKGGITLAVTADGAPSLLMSKPSGEVILALPEGAHAPPYGDDAPPPSRGK